MARVIKWLWPNVLTWCAGVAALLLRPSPSPSASPSPILVQNREHEFHDGADEPGWIVVGLDLVDSVAVDLGMPVVGLMRGDNIIFSAVCRSMWLIGLHAVSFGCIFVIGTYV